MANKNIVIDDIKPPNSEGDELLTFYFLPDTYALYDPSSNKPVVTGIKAGSIFQYTPPGGKKFTIVVHSIDEECASGKWFDPDAVKDAGGQGTFQAEAGGTGTPEGEAAAARA